MEPVSISKLLRLMLHTVLVTTGSKHLHVLEQSVASTSPRFFGARRGKLWHRCSCTFQTSHTEGFVCLCDLMPQSPLHNSDSDFPKLSKLYSDESRQILSNLEPLNLCSRTLDPHLSNYEAPRHPIHTQILISQMHSDGIHCWTAFSNSRSVESAHVIRATPELHVQRPNHVAATGTLTLIGLT